MSWKRFVKINFIAKNFEFSIYFLLVIIATAIGGLITGSIQPDSGSYINFYSARTSLYPLFLEIILGGSGSYALVGLIQTAIFLLTFYFLLTAVNKVFLKSGILARLFGIALSLNVYFHSYHWQILTESVVFSTINVMTVFFLSLLEKTSLKPVLGIGFCVGILVGLKPAMAFLLPVVPLLLLVVFFQKKQSLISMLVIFLVGVSVPLVVESVFYHKKYNQRSSLLSLTAFGKAAILSTYPEFAIPKLPPKQNEWMLEIDKEMQPLQNWKQKGTNIFVQGTVSSYAEVGAQYQLEKYINSNKHLPKLSREEKLQMGLKVIYANQGPFLKEVFKNFINMWGVGTLRFFVYHLDVSLPQFKGKYLECCVPKINKKGKYINLFAALSFFIFPSFLLMGLLVGCVWILSLVHLIYHNFKFKNTDNRIVFLFGSIVYAGVLMVALTNIPTPRYLMPFFPLVLLMLLISVKRIAACCQKSI